MNYEYGTGQQGLNYPNPYKIENTILSIRMVLFFVTSLALFVMAKLDLDKSNFIGLGLNIIIAIGFLSGAITTGYKISHQLRVYFGRGQPKSLTPDISADIEGFSEQALHLKETIRQGALNVVTPGGNLNGFLYNHFKHLIIAPPEVQFLTQRSFGNAIKMGIVLSLFALSSFFALGSNANGWLGLYFFIVVLYLIITPLLKENTTQIDLSLSAFWKLFATALIVPIGIVLIGKELPNINQYYFGWQSFSILILSIAGELLLLKALFYQLENPTGITTAFEQEAITFNAPPNQLIFEIERKLQDQWVSTVPNRIYSRIMPKIAMGRTDNFKGQIIQETQPMAPKALADGQTLEYILNDNRKKYLFYIDFIALILNLVATVGILVILFRIHNDWKNNINFLAWTPICLGLMSLGIYLVKIIHSLWGRFDFESKLYIFDLEGNYSTAEVNYGNYMRDTFQTRKDIVNIESMTLRIWVTHLRTAVFGHGINSETRPRRIINMTGLKDESKTWLQTIKQFAQNQSMVVAPTSPEDIKRANAIAQLNAVGNTLNQGHKDALDAMSKESANAAAAALKEIEDKGFGQDVPPPPNN